MDEDSDGHISFREFLLIFRKAAAGELSEDSGLGVLARQCEIDVDEVGVGGAKDFFEAKGSLFQEKSRVKFGERVCLIFRLPPFFGQVAQYHKTVSSVLDQCSYIYFFPTLLF